MSRARERQSGCGDFTVSVSFWEFDLRTCREPNDQRPLEGARSVKKEGGGFGASAPALRSRRENCGGQMKPTKHHRLICFSGKAKSVDNKRDPISINMNQHGEHNMFHTMIPWLRVRMGL